MGYGNLKKWLVDNPKVDRFYFCKVCGIFNNPFDFYKEFEQLCKENICKRCMEKANRKELFGHEKAVKVDVNE